MEIRPQYLQHYLHDIAIDQLTADYEAKGYQVSTNDKIEGYHPDLVARKGDEVVVIEVKAGKLTAERRRQVAVIGDYVRSHKNYKFLVVLATPPKPKKIDIPNLAQVLVNYLNSNYTTDLSNKLHAYGAQFLSVTDLVLNEFTLNETGTITVVGNAMVEVEFKYANNIEGIIDEADTAYGDIFPCVFDITLTQTSDNQLVISTVKSISINTAD